MKERPAIDWLLDEARRERKDAERAVPDNSGQSGDEYREDALPPSTFVTTWSCERCTGRGDLEFPRGTMYEKVVEAIAKDHKKQSPECRSQTGRMRWYDATRQVVR